MPASFPTPPLEKIPVFAHSHLYGIILYIRPVRVPARSLSRVLCQHNILSTIYSGRLDTAVDLVNSYREAQSQENLLQMTYPWCPYPAPQ